MQTHPSIRERAVLRKTSTTLGLFLFMAASSSSLASQSGKSKDAIAQEVAVNFNTPGCARVFERFTPALKKAIPQKQNAAFCRQVIDAQGKIKAVTPAGREGNWRLYELTAERGSWIMKLGFDSSSAIDGINFVPGAPPVTTTKSKLGWPLTVPTLVYWGGETEEVNYHVVHPQQRRALDLDSVSSNGKTHSGDGKKNADYAIYGAQIVSVADGTVLHVVDGVEDNVPGVMNAYFIPGNTVVVDHGNGEYAHYAHLKPGSVRVKKGQRVKAGDALGLVGNSGNSSEPHLHFHLQDSPRFGQGYGIRPEFVDVNVNVNVNVNVKRNGKSKRMKSYRPTKGDVVTPR